MGQSSWDTAAEGAPRVGGGSFIDLAPRAAVLLSGRDGQDLLHRLSTNDLSQLSEGGCVQTILTNEKGRIIDVLSVLKLGSRELLLVGQSANPEALIGWINKFIITEDAQVEPAASLYADVAILDFDSEAHWMHVVTGLGGLRAYTEDWGRAKLLHFLVENSRRDAFMRILATAGLKPVGPAEFEEFRIRSGIPRHPNELSTSYNPLEANLGHLISWTKGCYVGQEVIARLDTYGKVQRRLVRLKLSAMPEALPETLVDETNEAGTLTSAAKMRDGLSVLGLGYVQTNLVRRGQCFAVRANRNNIAEILFDRSSDTIVAEG